jgi:hypothetical protein
MGAEETGMRITEDIMFARATSLLEAEVDDELVALDVKLGKCFGFNPVATSIWKLLAQPRSFAELRRELLEEYEVDTEQCTEELAALLHELVELGLAKRTEEAAHAG